MKKNPSIGKLNKWLQTAHAHYFMTVSEWSRGKTVVFSEVFFSDLGIDSSCLDAFDSHADIAVVNENSLDMCFHTDKGLSLKIQGTAYKVIATYKDTQDDKLFETSYYLNQSAQSLQDKNFYDYILLEPMAGEAPDTIAKRFESTFPNISVSIWNRQNSNWLDNRPYFVTVIMLVAILLCVNCIGFSNEWIKAQMQEFGIRKLIGATDRTNHYLLLKRLLQMFMISYLTGILFAIVTFLFIKHLPGLDATRNLFGTYLYPKSAVCSGISVFMIGMLLTEFNLFFLRKRDIVTCIRGGK